MYQNFVFTIKGTIIQGIMVLLVQTNRTYTGIRNQTNYTEKNRPKLVLLRGKKQINLLIA